MINPNDLRWCETGVPGGSNHLRVVRGAGHKAHRLVAEMGVRTTLCGVRARRDLHAVSRRALTRPDPAHTTRSWPCPWCVGRALRVEMSPGEAGMIADLFIRSGGTVSPAGRRQPNVELREAVFGLSRHVRSEALALATEVAALDAAGFKHDRSAAIARSRHRLYLRGHLWESEMWERAVDLAADGATRRLEHIRQLAADLAP